MKHIFCILIIILLSSVAYGESQQGIFTYDIGDSHDQRNIILTRYYLQTENKAIELEMSDAFVSSHQVQGFFNKNVKITFANQGNPIQKRKVKSIELMQGAQRGSGVFGSQPWVSILCKFNDIQTEPNDLNYFKNMYANSFAGLDHYWREVSYNQIDIIGSIAVDWVDLPKSRGEYITTSGDDTDADLSLLFEDCTDAADSLVDFADIGDGQTSFVGINMMFNETLDCCAWGGGRFATLDGLSKFWRVTWEPPWSYANEAVIAHEMGHGFGLPHANNSDEDSNTYDSPWDVMSSATGYAVTHNVYGKLGKHINMFHKRLLTWVNDNDDGFVANMSSNENISIDRTDLASTDNYRFARIPLSDGTYYMVEVRKTTASYEIELPGSAVIIHHIDAERNQPSWVVDEDMPAATYSDNEGSMWKVGEIFEDEIDGYSLTVISSTTDGFVINITAPQDYIFENSFE